MSGQLRRAAVVAAACAFVVSTHAAAATAPPASIKGSSLIELAVTITGNGFGTVTDDSSPPGTCSTTSLQPCVFTYASPAVTPTVHAAPAPGSYFAGWGEIGAGCGTTPTCLITFPNPTNQTQFQLLAIFNRNPAPAPVPRHHTRHHHACTNDPGIDASNDPACPRSHLRPSTPAAD